MSVYQSASIIKIWVIAKMAHGIYLTDQSLSQTHPVKMQLMLAQKMKTTKFFCIDILMADFLTDQQTTNSSWWQYSRCFFGKSYEL